MEINKIIYSRYNTIYVSQISSWPYQTCVSVNNSLSGKLVLPLEFSIKFYERFKLASVPFVIADFNLLSH